ncbi:MAG: ABC transporter ATP-binding protein [Microscillaceae bacterium]|nr:ABC transporter ATP-binding protein [Microscillaceae bacterium]
MKSLAYLNKYLRKYQFLLILGIFFTIISNIFSIAPAPIVRYAFDLIEESIRVYQLYDGFSKQEAIYADFAWNVLLYGLLIVAMALLRGVFLFFVRQTIIVMSRHIEYDLKNEIYKHYQELPMSFYRRNNTGDLMARISEDVSHVRMYLGPAIMYSINLITLCIMVVVFMFMIDAKLAFFTLLPLPFLSISIYFVSNVINRQSTEIQQSLSGLSTFVQEAFSGIRVIKAFDREQDSVRNFSKESEVYKNKSISLSLVQALFFPLIIGLIGLSTILIVYIGGVEVINGKITSGVIAEFIIYVNMLTWPVTSIGWVTSLVQRAAASQERINEFLNTHTDIISQKNLEKPIHGEVEFKNVYFTYPDTGIKALKDISFKIESGETLAVLGTTGSGKSTVANLLTRMYDVTQGEILIDGINIRDFSLKNLRSQMGYVPQDVFLFSDTIRNNIAFGLDLINEEKIIQAAKDADLYENVMDFEYQFNTRIGERGISLSGGQKQRLSIARAIVREPKILILDDSLSAVDTKTENAILNNLKTIMENRTSLIISHRVSSVKLADKIIVLDDGKIVQQGTHDTLITQEGMYKELYEKQLQSEDSVSEL